MGSAYRMSDAPINPKLAELQAMAAASRVGGKGSVRRRKKVVHKNVNAADDKRLQNTLKKLGINTIPAIEEVNLFMESGEVIYFNQPKVQASIAANTYVIVGRAETKKLQDLFPSIFNQVDKSVLPSLKKIAEQYQGGAAAADDDDDDDEVPDLVENFEDASKASVPAATKKAAAPEAEFDFAAARKAAQGTKLTEEEKKARGLLYDTSKARAVREESDDDEEGVLTPVVSISVDGPAPKVTVTLKGEDDSADFAGGDPFEGL